MALRIWLPLNGNLNNQGLSNVTVTNSGATVNTAGKIGSCYRFETNSKYLLLDKKCCDLFSDGDSFSYCCWVKVSAYPTSSSGGGLGGTVTYQTETSTVNGTTKNGGGFGFLINTSGSIYAYANPFSGSKGITIGTVPLNTWTHYCMTYEKSTKVLSVYQNGNFVTSSTATTDWGSNGRQFIFGRGSQGGWQNTMDSYQNDIRIYDHCLSQKEVREIAKGLVLHYKLDYNVCGQGSTNLFMNGWGGTENWSNNTSSTVSTSVPSSPTGITNSYSAGNSTKEYIPIIKDHSYTISAYVKKNASSAAYCYLSLIPYDVDKLQINAQNEADGFKAASLTTLSQDLHNGDTVVHLTDASGWANPSTYQIWVAIFGYKDSTGYTYPDLVYTRRVYQYGTTTDKSHLDVANNQVTLNSAYSGETIPAGTSVCLSASGSGYYYPNSIKAENATDWTLLTKTFTPNSVNFLKAAKYVRFICLSSYQWVAGLTLIDNSASTIISDVSGNGHNGTIVGTLETSTNSSRYSASTTFNGRDTGVLIENLNIGNIINTAITYSFWIKPDGDNGGRSVYFGSYSGVSFSIEKTTANKLRLYWNGTPDTTTNLSITDGEWQHIVITKNGTTEMKVYLNGSLVQTITSRFNDLTFPTTFRIGRDSRSNDGTPYKGLMSDFRIYSTVLSADDVKELYNTASYIDNGYTFNAYEFNEINTNSRELNPWAADKITSKASNGGYNLLPDGSIECYSRIFLNSDYIPIGPDNKTYYYDYEYSNTSGNRFYIGIEKFDANKNTGSNGECQYQVNTTAAKNHERVTGTVTLSTANGNTAAYIRLRVLNDWSTSGTVTNIGTVHHISIKEVSTLTESKINKTGVFDGDAFIEDSGSSISKTGNIIANQLIEI